jgi:hypothetical protein
MGTSGFDDWWAKRGAWFSKEFHLYIDGTKTALGGYKRWAEGEQPDSR